MIELKIAADSAAEALNDLAELAKIVGLIEGVAEERNKTATQTEKAQSPSPMPEDIAPWAESEPIGEEPVTERTYTLEELRAAGVAAARTHGKAAVQTILKALDANSMTALKQGQYPEFMKRLGELNAE